MNRLGRVEIPQEAFLAVLKVGQTEKEEVLPVGSLRG